MPRYDWDEVQKYYDDGHSYFECRKHFGFSPGAWTAAVKAKKLRAKARQLTALRYIVSGKPRKDIRERLLSEGFLHNQCYECGISEWFGEKLPLHLDHKNGIKDDHRLENLRMLCPNCHSQTETFGGRNTKKRQRYALGS